MREPAVSNHPWRLSVAPMMDWTDRHCRYFHRLITSRTRLYTEMVTTGALLHGDVPRHLAFDAAEHPLALQLGGSEPVDLAACAALAQTWGYDEVNLNCGCPSERVQRGAFGACLMNEPSLVRDCVKAMVDACGLPITVKHRIGVDKSETYGFVRDFVGTVADGGCTVFIVHARSAWLQGLSPKQNRELPPLRYEWVARLKADFPELTFAINGGLSTAPAIAEQLALIGGVMVGREAYHNPWVMHDWDARFFDNQTPAAALELSAQEQWAQRHPIEQGMVAYCEAMVAADAAREAAQPGSVKHPFVWHHAMRHVLGLYNGLAGARHWRQVWSDHTMKALPAREVMRLAQPRR